MSISKFCIPNANANLCLQICDTGIWEITLDLETRNKIFNYLGMPNGYEVTKMPVSQPCFDNNFLHCSNLL